MHSFHLGQVLDNAAERGYGVPAFNVNNLEQIQAIMEAARETDSPVILQASAGARKYRPPAGHERCDAQVFAEQPSEFDPRKAYAEPRKAARGIVKARFEAFSCAGQAARLKPVALEAMVPGYR